MDSDEERYRRDFLDFFNFFSFLSFFDFRLSGLDLEKFLNIFKKFQKFTYRLHRKQFDCACPVVNPFASFSLSLLQL